MPQKWRKKIQFTIFPFFPPSCSCFLKIPSCSTLATHQPLAHHAPKCSLSSFSSFLKSCFFCESFLHHFSPCWWLQTFSHLNYCPVCIVSIWVRLLGPYPKGPQPLLRPSAHKHSKGNYKILIRRTQQGSSWGAAYKMSWGRCKTCWSLVSLPWRFKHHFGEVWSNAWRQKLCCKHHYKSFPQPDSRLTERAWLLLVEFLVIPQ